MVTYDQVKPGDYIGMRSPDDTIYFLGEILEKHKGHLIIRWIYNNSEWTGLRTIFGQYQIDKYNVNSYIKWKKFNKREVILEML